MTKLDQLIKELCPNGVEFVCLGTVLKNNNASDSISKKDYKEAGRYPIIDQSQSYITAYTDNESAVPPAFPCIVFGDHTRVIKYANQKFAQGDSGTKVFIAANNKIEIKYLYYAFCNLNIPSRGYNRHWTIAKDIKIPLPPLAVQREIVRILDNFTELTAELIAELTAELTARRKQYEYYRDQLLTFGDDVPMVALRDVCLRTNNIRWKDTVGEFYYIDLTSVDRETNKIRPEQVINSENAPSRAQQIVKTNDVLFATTRPTLQRYCIIPSEYDGQICSTGYCVLRANNQVIMPRFLYYTITTGDFNLYVENNQEGTSYPAISDSNVKKYKFHLPSLPEQAHIVAILDKIDDLTADITNDLPAEIKARRKQYEYYRDKLLTFKEVGA